ncbi:30S ribosomal protein S27ae [Salinarchaeum sp. Harcht-Bsk1]|nr:30S ribosomal protein S27ae [Salinarchaeum sp. Harcht-Bsk1]AGN02723.1 30S ribosomal protein S27ae [Salinarchaeum sp. Harcht-Bsk1]
MSRHELYGDDGEIDRQPCPRCEDTFLGEHEDRLHCGKCGYTEWK